jgi:HNH endonuclease
MITAAPEDVARFLSYAEKLPCGCWYWTGARSRGGGNRKWYGSFSVGGKVVRAHRFSSEVLAGDECPPGHHRDHICCFSMCVNPAHLEVVTRQENQRRKLARKLRDEQCTNQTA